MKVKEIKNSLGETFQIKEINCKNGSLTIETTIPPGLAIDKLHECKQDIEYALGGDVDIRPNKYKSLVLITVNTNPAERKNVLTSQWTNILSEASIKKCLRGDSKIFSITLKDNSSYEIIIKPPSQYNYNPSDNLKGKFEDYLDKEAIVQIDLINNKIKLLITREIE